MVFENLSSYTLILNRTATMWKFEKLWRKKLRFDTFQCIKSGGQHQNLTQFWWHKGVQLVTQFSLLSGYVPPCIRCNDISIQWIFKQHIRVCSSLKNFKITGWHLNTLLQNYNMENPSVQIWRYSASNRIPSWLNFPEKCPPGY